VHIVARLSAALLAVMAVLLPAVPAAADEVADGQWYVPALQLKQAHAISTGQGVTVAVVDSGVDATHPDLKGSVLPGADFSTSFTTSSGDGRTDTNGHGTGIAALIAGHGRVQGVAPAAKILPVRISSSSGNIPAAVQWAVANGAKVINIALAGSVPEAREQAAVEKALAADVVVVAGAGNLPENATVAYPAAYPGVVAACATTKNGGHASISTTGPQVMLCAPGEKISTAYTAHKYVLTSGTSDATALIAGTAALLRAKHPQLSAADVIRQLTSTATDKGAAGRDDLYGYGIVNPLAALTANVATAPASAAAATSAASAPSAATTEPADNVGLQRVIILGGVCLILVLGAAAALATWLIVRRRQ